MIRTALSNRVARVQGQLFQATFLRKVPLFLKLIAENLALCLAQSLVISSLNFLRGILRLKWREILTLSIHNNYFQVWGSIRGLVFPGGFVVLFWAFWAI